MPKDFLENCHCPFCLKGGCHYCGVKVLYVRKEAQRDGSPGTPLQSYAEGCGENVLRAPPGHKYFRACELHWLPRPWPLGIQMGIDMLALSAAQEITPAEVLEAITPYWHMLTPQKRHQLAHRIWTARHVQREQHWILTSNSSAP